MLVYADFMKLYKSIGLKLVCEGTFADLERLGLSLRPGLRLTFYNEDEDNSGVRDDLVVSGIVDFDVTTDVWFARIDFSKIKNISSLSESERDELGIPIGKTHGP